MSIRSEAKGGGKRHHNLWWTVYVSIAHDRTMSTRSPEAKGGGGGKRLIISDELFKCPLLMTVRAVSVRVPDLLKPKSRQRNLWWTIYVCWLIAWVQCHRIGCYRDLFYHFKCFCECFQGQALIFAPSRSRTFHKFVGVAEKLFQVVVDAEYDKRVWNLHQAVSLL